MNRVLVFVPANMTCEYERRFSMDLEKARSMIEESSHDKRHTFARMRIVPESEWALHRFERNHNGDPVSAPRKQTLCREEYEDHKASLAHITEAEPEIVHDMQTTIEVLNEKVRSLESAQSRTDAEIVASAKEREQKLAKAAGKKPAKSGRTTK